MVYDLVFILVIVSLWCNHVLLFPSYHVSLAVLYMSKVKKQNLKVKGKTEPITAKFLQKGGWKILREQRKSGKSKGEIDTYYIPPAGKPRLASIAEVKAYMKS